MCGYFKVCQLKKLGSRAKPSGKLLCRVSEFECTESNQVAQQSSLQGEHSTLLRFRGGDVPAHKKGIY